MQVTLERDSVLKILQSHLAELTNMGVLTLAIFGSVARDEASNLSDVDILVELSQPHTFRKYMTVKLYLEEILGCPVDLVMPAKIKPRLLPSIKEDAVYVTR